MNEEKWAEFLEIIKPFKEPSPGSLIGVNWDGSTLAEEIREMDSRRSIFLKSQLDFFQELD